MEEMDSRDAVFSAVVCLYKMSCTISLSVLLSKIQIEHPADMMADRKPTSMKLQLLFCSLEKQKPPCFERNESVIQYVESCLMYKQLWNRM